jgi:CIC family chloride channel protein
LIVAADLAVAPVATVTPEDNLHTVLRRCAQKNITEIPVVGQDHPHRVRCMLTRQNVMAAYDRRMCELRAGRAK